MSTTRIAKVQAAHPWMTADEAATLLAANYVVNAGNYTSFTAKNIAGFTQCMEDFAQLVCGLSEAQVKEALTMAQKEEAV
jgi:hypothetical protein